MPDKTNSHCTYMYIHTCHMHLHLLLLSLHPLPPPLIYSTLGSLFHFSPPHPPPTSCLHVCLLQTYSYSSFHSFLIHSSVLPYPSMLFLPILTVRMNMFVILWQFIFTVLLNNHDVKHPFLILPACAALTCFIYMNNLSG